MSASSLTTSRTTASRTSSSSFFSTTSVSATRTTSDTPFFPTHTGITQPSDLPGTNSGLMKAVLEWLFLVVALLTLGVIVGWRFLQLRQHNRPLREFFTRRRRRDSHGSTRSAVRNIPRTGLPRMTVGSADGRIPYYSYIAPPTSAYPYRSRRTRGADVDAFGRRTGGGGDYDELGDKDELPAYEHAGGPPKYMDLEVVYLESVQRPSAEEVEMGRSSSGDSPLPPEIIQVSPTEEGGRSEEGFSDIRSPTSSEEHPQTIVIDTRPLSPT